MICISFLSRIIVENVVRNDKDSRTQDRWEQMKNSEISINESLDKEKVVTDMYCNEMDVDQTSHNSGISETVSDTNDCINVDMKVQESEQKLATDEDIMPCVVDVMESVLIPIDEPKIDQINDQRNDNKDLQKNSKANSEQNNVAQVRNLTRKQPGVKQFYSASSTKRKDCPLKESLSSVGKNTLQPKKRIYLKRRRHVARENIRPATRLKQDNIASWIKKYNIEECWVRLDLFDPIRDQI